MPPVGWQADEDDNEATVFGFCETDSCRPGDDGWHTPPPDTVDDEADKIEDEQDAVTGGDVDDESRAEQERERVVDTAVEMLGVSRAEAEGFADAMLTVLESAAGELSPGDKVEALQRLETMVTSGAITSRQVRKITMLADKVALQATPAATSNQLRLQPLPSGAITVALGASLAMRVGTIWSRALPVASGTALSDSPVPGVMDLVALGVLSVAAGQTLGELLKELSYSFAKDNTGETQSGTGSLAGETAGTPNPQCPEDIDCTGDIHKDLANEIARHTYGEVTQLRNGYEVTIPHGNRGIVIRIMKSGGGRTNYYRVSVPGKQAFTSDGAVSMDRGLTHIDISKTTLDDILNLVNRIKGGF